MRILLVGQFFDPEPSFKGMNFARALVARGHQVEVLTGFPNYPGGIVYPGYRIRPFQREWMDGIPINRVALYPSHSRSSLGRALNYLSFAASGTLGALLAVSRADVAYVYHPPATAVIPAMAMRAIRRIPYVLDVQDLWPDTLAATGMVPAGLPLRMVDTLVRATYRNAAHVVVQSHGFRECLLARGIPAEKVTVVYNWCDAPSLRGSDAEVGELVATAPREHFTILFAGTMGLAQGLDTVLDAAALCTTRLPNARFIFVGGGSDRERLERSSKKRGLQNVEFHPPRPPRAMPELFTQADVLLVHLKDEPLFRITIPSKTQAYLAIGKPVLMARSRPGSRRAGRARGSRHHLYAGRPRSNRACTYRAPRRGASGAIAHGPRRSTLLRREALARRRR